MHRTNQTEFTEKLNFVYFARTHQPAINAEVNFLAVNKETEEVFLYTIGLRKPLLRASISDADCWEHKIVKVGGSSKDLYRDVYNMRECFFIPSFN